MAKVLCIIGAGPDQIPAYELAKQMELLIVGVDMNANAPGLALADYRIVVSTKDIENIIKNLVGLLQKGVMIDGVMTIAAEVSPTVAAIAEYFKLPGVSRQTAYLTTNKCARAEVFTKSGVNYPKYWIGKNLEELPTVEYPVVIKPSDNSASRGVRMVNSYQELQSLFNEAVSLSSDGNVILEQYIEGLQLSIEGVVVNQELYVTGIADRNYSRNQNFYPFFVEDGGEMPTRHDAQVIQNVIQEFKKAVQALNITIGATKGDIIIDSFGKVYVIEVTSRLSGGGFCSRVVPMTTGVNIVNTVIEQSIGLNPDIQDLIPKFQKGMCHRFFFHKPGKINEIRGLDNVAKMPGIKDFVIQRLFEVGDILDPVTYANRLFYVISIADDRTTAIRYAEDAINSVEIIVE